MCFFMLAISKQIKVKGIELDYTLYYFTFMSGGDIILIVLVSFRFHA